MSGTKLLAFFLTLNYFLFSFISYTFAQASSCNSIGINPTFDPVNPIPEGTTSLKISFTNIEDGRYQLRFRLGPRDIYAGDNGGSGTTASGGQLAITVNNTDGKLSKDPIFGGPEHTSTLEKWNEAERKWKDFCGYITYRVGSGLLSCKITFDSTAAVSNAKFSLNITDGPKGQYDLYLGNNDPLRVSGEKVTDESNNPVRITIDDFGRGSAIIGPFTPRSGALWLDSGTALGRICFTPINIRSTGGSTPGVSCPITPPNPTSSDRVFISGINVVKNQEFYFYIDDTKIEGFVNSGSTGVIQQELGSLPDGKHTGYIYDSNDKPVCSKEFSVGPRLPGSATGPAATPCTDSNKCATSKGDPCDDGKGINTAIGCIHTDPPTLIRDVLKFVIAIAGGIALLLMIIGAFGMITSAGNPESLASSRDRFVKAIEGLLFILFAVLLLGIIGVDLLGLGKFFGY